MDSGFGFHRAPAARVGPGQDADDAGSEAGVVHCIRADRRGDGDLRDLIRGVTDPESAPDPSALLFPDMAGRMLSQAQGSLLASMRNNANTVPFAVCSSSLGSQIVEPGRLLGCI